MKINTPKEFISYPIRTFIPDEFIGLFDKFVQVKKLPIERNIDYIIENGEIFVPYVYYTKGPWTKDEFDMYLSACLKDSGSVRTCVGSTFVLFGEYIRGLLAIIKTCDPCFYKEDRDMSNPNFLLGPCDYISGLCVCPVYMIASMACFVEIEARKELRRLCLELRDQYRTREVALDSFDLSDFEKQNGLN